MMTVPAGLLALIDETPDAPWDALAIIADWCDDNDMLRLAYWFRWMVEERKIPHESQSDRLFMWWKRPIAGTQSEIELLSSVHGHWYDCHRSASAAYLAAALELAKQPRTLTETRR